MALTVEQLCEDAVLAATIGNLEAAAKIVAKIRTLARTKDLELLHETDAKIAAAIQKNLKLHNN